MSLTGLFTLGFSLITVCEAGHLIRYKHANHMIHLSYARYTEHFIGNIDTKSKLKIKHTDVDTEDQ